MGFKFSLRVTSFTNAELPADSVKLTKCVVAVAVNVVSVSRTSLPLAIVSALDVVCHQPDIVPMSRVSVAPLV